MLRVRLQSWILGELVLVRKGMLAVFDYTLLSTSRWLLGPVARGALGKP